MFTGVIETMGRIVQLERRPTGRRLMIEAPPRWHRLRLGDSVAVNGVCLSIAARRGPRFIFDLVPETLRRTTLGALSPGERVHLERAMRARDRLHGHVLLGHVDGTARVVAARVTGHERWLDLLLPTRLLRYCVPKGSIAVDGVSLTIGQVRGQRLRLYLIPMTLRRTLLGQKQAGDRANIETDILAKTALRC